MAKGGREVLYINLIFNLSSLLTGRGGGGRGVNSWRNVSFNQPFAPRVSSPRKRGEDRRRGGGVGRVIDTDGGMREEEKGAAAAAAAWKGVEGRMEYTYSANKNRQ